MSESFYKSLLHESPIGYAFHKVIFDSNSKVIDYEFLEINPAFEQITGIKASEWIGIRASEISGGIESIMNWGAKIYEEIKPNCEKKQLDYYSRNLNRYFRINLLSVDDANFVLYITDITKEKKVLEEKIAICTGLNDIVFELNEALEFTQVYISDENKLLISRKELIGSRSNQIFPPESSDEFDQLLLKVKRTRIKESLIYQLPILGSDKWHRVEIYYREINDNNRYIVSVSDITEQKILQDKWNETSEQLERFFSLELDLLCIIDNEGNFIKVNKSWEQILGYSVDELETKNIFEFIHLEDLEKTKEALISLGEQSELINFVNRYRSKDGSYKSIEWNAHPYGNIIYSAARDITVQMEILDALQKSEEKYRLIAENMSDVIWIFNLDTSRFNYVSPSIKQLIGYSAEEITSDKITNITNFITMESYNKLHEQVSKARERFLNSDELLHSNRFEITLYCKNGQQIWAEISVNFRYNDENQIEMYGVASNIDERKNTEKLQYIGNHDQLTGVYNRHFFETIIKEEMHRVGRYYEPLSIALLDLDFFKVVNDTWGHPVGDEVLKITAHEISKHVRSCDILVRFGGEEFLILMPHTNLEGAYSAAEKIRAEIAANIIPDVGVCTVSIGVSERIRGESFEDWYVRVDEALYKAKQNGRNRVEKY